MKAKNKLRANYGGPLRAHWLWSVVLACSLLILDAVLFLRDRDSGLVAMIFTAAYFLVVIALYFYFRSRILRELVDFATGYGQIQKQILANFELPLTLLEPDGRILWMNEKMSILTDKDSSFRKNIEVLFPEIQRTTLPSDTWERDVNVSYQEKEFRAHIQRISIEDLIEQSEVVNREVGTNYLYMLYLYDETDLRKYVRELRDDQPVVGLIYIDNFEEVMEGSDEVHQSLLSVLVERRINKYFSGADGLVKKLEKDKYVIILTRKGLDGLMQDRFSVLEGVKTINIGNEISMTISGGFGMDGASYPDNYEYARGAIEMALGRGGDQVVIRSGEEMSFFGGKTQFNEKNTRVKARVKAQALRELILAQDRVVAMGHSITDMDSLGAAIGVWRAAVTVGKPAHIVLGDLNTNIRDWVTKFRENKDYPEDMFISHEKAMELTGPSTTVIVVDTNRENMVECRQILKQTNSIVVLDHHRQTTDTVQNASLSYIEPTASSACEMIAEILQYFEEDVKLRNLEADCIYAGIVIDTQSFVTKTGVRTFEAAAYLRRCGADVTRVRKALRDNLSSYMAKMEAVAGTETFMDHYAISVCNGEGLEDPTVVGAQAANDLLNIVGIKASFVLTQVQDRIFISARSIDELNVQLVMERLGGGGHLNTAGAQISGATPAEAADQLKEVLRTMTEEGAI